MPLASYDPNEQCWKTSEATSLWALKMSSLTLPPWGCLHGGELYELPTPERPTIERACSSLLATPTTMDNLPARTGEAYQKAKNQGGRKNRKATGNLREQVVHLPTPRAQNGEPRNQNIWRRDVGPQNLENALALLPTPEVNDMGAGKDPQAWDEWAARQRAADGRPAPHGKSLEQEALRVGATTPPPLTAGSTSSDAHHQAPLFSEQDEIA
jgi:hypothetical protein